MTLKDSSICSKDCSLNYVIMIYEEHLSLYLFQCQQWSKYFNRLQSFVDCKCNIFCTNKLFVQYCGLRFMLEMFVFFFFLFIITSNIINVNGSCILLIRFSTFRKNLLHDLIHTCIFVSWISTCVFLLCVFSYGSVNRNFDLFGNTIFF